MDTIGPNTKPYPQYQATDQPIPRDQVHQGVIIPVTIHTMSNIKIHILINDQPLSSWSANS